MDTSINNFLPLNLLQDIDVNYSDEVTDEDSPTELRMKTRAQNQKAKIQKFPVLNSGNFISSQTLYNQNCYNQSMVMRGYPSNANQHQSRPQSHQSNPKISLLTYEGSQKYQKNFRFNSQDSISALLMSIKNTIPEIMCNAYGNYFLQKVIKYSTNSHRIFILSSIKNAFITICENNFGTHCIQTLISCINSVEEEKIIKMCIKDYLLRLSTNQNSLQIIVKLLSNIQNHKRKYLFKFLLSNFGVLSRNLNGAIVVKKFISEVTDPLTIDVILNMIELDIISLCKDKYANYVVQFAIEKFGYNRSEKIINSIISNLLVLSVEKYSSNVIDKIMIMIKENEKQKFSNICFVLMTSQDKFYSMTSTKFGQYVLINMIKELDPNVKQSLKYILVNMKARYFKIVEGLLI